MPVYAVGDAVPEIDPSAFIAPTATVVGRVTILAGASVWYGAVVRGDTMTGTASGLQTLRVRVE